MGTVLASDGGAEAPVAREGSPAGTEFWQSRVDNILVVETLVVGGFRGCWALFILWAYTH
jgi:hypothetical protein